MNPQQIISMLEPLRAPAALPWWPPAPGWWLLAALLLALVAWALHRLRQRWRRRAPLRHAHRELAALQTMQLSPVELATRLGQLQRRLVLAIRGRRDCARLSGARWIALLNELAGEPLFDEAAADLSYRPAVAQDAALRALEDNQRWLRCLEKRW